MVRKLTPSKPWHLGRLDGLDGELAVLRDAPLRIRVGLAVKPDTHGSDA